MIQSQECNETYEWAIDNWFGWLTIWKLCLIPEWSANLQFLCVVPIFSYCCAASEAAVHIPYTGKILSCTLATIMLYDTWLHNDMFCMSSFVPKRSFLFIILSINLWCFWEAIIKTFWVQKCSNYLLLLPDLFWLLDHNIIGLTRVGGNCLMKSLFVPMLRSSSSL